MRCLILIALCFLLADATYLNKNRFQRLLNRYQNQNRGNFGDLYGSDDVDDYIRDYVDETRRQGMWGDDEQCQGGYGGMLGGMCDVEGGQEFEDFEGLGDFENQYTTGGHHGDIYGQEEEFGTGLGSFGMESETGINYLLKEVEDANVKLTARLYKECKDEKDDKNIVVSPLSIQLALAALNYGTRGNTKRQISHVIGGRLQKHERKQIFSTLVRHLKGFRQNEYNTRRGITKINPVTGIFVTSTTRTPTQHQFIQRIKTTLGATVKHCNFHTNPQQCRQMINQWMSQKTNHKISRIIPQDAITDNTKMILVNGLELKAKWGQQMLNHQTKEAKFYPLDTNKVKIVEVMETQGRFKYCEDELVKIVGIPTQQKEMTLYVIVPKYKDGLTEVEKLHLQDGVQLKQLLDKCEKRRQVHKVHVQLPKFTIKHKVDVRRTLRKQGVTDAFDPLRADFSGITGVNTQHGLEEDDDVFGQQQQQWMRYRRNPFLNRFSRNSMFQQGGDLEDAMFQGGDEYSQYNQGMTTGHTDKKLHLNKFIHQTIIKITGQGITATSGSGSDQYGHGLGQSEHFGQWDQEEGVTGRHFGGHQWDQEEGMTGRGFGRQQWTQDEDHIGGRWGQGQGIGGRGFGDMTDLDELNEFTGFYGRGFGGLSGGIGSGTTKVVKANHAFAFVLKHNPTKQVVLVGRVIDAAQKKVNYLPQTIDTVDQL